MKIRKGLVSNSSSSSFMCTFGKITDKEKFDAWCRKEDLEYNIVKGEEICTHPDPEDEYWKFFEGLDGDFLGYMLNRKDIIKIIEKDPDAFYLISGDQGFEGDDFYWDGDEYDYDLVGEDTFLREVKSICDADGFKVMGSCLYAGRDG